MVYAFGLVMPVSGFTRAQARDPEKIGIGRVQNGVMLECPGESPDQYSQSSLPSSIASFICLSKCAGMFSCTFFP